MANYAVPTIGQQTNNPEQGITLRCNGHYQMLRVQRITTYRYIPLSSSDEDGSEYFSASPGHSESNSEVNSKTGLYLAELEALGATPMEDLVGLSRPPSPPDSNVVEETGLMYDELELLGSLAVEDLELPFPSDPPLPVPPPISQVCLPAPVHPSPDHADLCVNGEWVDDFWVFLVLRGRHAVNPWKEHSVLEAVQDICAYQAQFPNDLDLFMGFMFPSGPYVLESTLVPWIVLLDLLIGWRELFVEARGASIPFLDLSTAPEDDEDAQAVEDLERLESNFDTWDDKWYTMRIEEANLISDMLVQLSRQLGLGAVVLADQGKNMKRLLDQVDWSRIVCCQDIVKNNPPDSALVKLINSAPDASTLKHVVFIFHQHAHWSLIHFNISTKAVYLIDSLPNLGAQRVTSDQLEIYSKLANILSTNHQEPLANCSTWHLSTIYTGHQPYSQENGIVLNLSCGFWSLFYALLTVLGAPIQQSLAHKDVVNTLWNLLLGYLDQHTGGLTQNVFIANLTEFIPNLRARFLQYAHMELWGPHQFNSTRTQAVGPEPNHSNNHPGSQTAQLIPRPLTHEEHLVVSGERLSAKGRAVLVILSSIRNTIPLEHTLEFPKANSTNNQQKGIWCHLTSFMPLLKDSPSRVSKLNPLGQKQKRKSVVYKSSLTSQSHAVEAVELVKTCLSNTSNGRKADKGQYNEKEWSFTIVSNTPQQSNTMDCGIFMLGYLMESALDWDLSWTQEQIAVFRACLAFQIQHGQVALHHLVIQAPSPHNNPAQQHYVNVTPKPLCKHLLSPSPPSSSAQPSLGSYANALSRQDPKRPRLAPFPVTKIAQPKAPIKKALADDQAKMDQLMSWKPSESSDHEDIGYQPEMRVAFRKHLQSNLKDSIPAPCNQNPDARLAKQGKLVQVHGLCDWHQTSTRSKALENETWPASISRQTLGIRLKKLVPLLTQVAQTPSGLQVYQLAKQFWEKTGRLCAVGSRGMWEAAEEWGYAYYGQEGNTLMFEFVMKLLDSRGLKIHWKNWAPVDDQHFAVYNILIPELPMHLVQQDMRGSMADAIRVIKDSQEYGDLGNSKLNK
ncbi:hypothetical protein BDV93DRAFT_512682 [Ceratobasidium sp. AG-I]|nr:hypothetical protein BDV93DRAFT_512682 [Ceratobasidium sp. AG-I]